MSENTKI